MAHELALNVLAPLAALSQAEGLVRVVQTLWQNPDVVAIWLGGSLARGAGDQYSDVDLRVAVTPSAFAQKQLPAGAAALEAQSVVALSLPMGNDAVLFHLLLDNGEIYDLFVQSTAHELAQEHRLVIGCRDAAFLATLKDGTDEPFRAKPADAAIIRQVIVNFWLGQQKHHKVLHRQLPLLAWFGQYIACQDLLRLWYVLATSSDCGPLQKATIHTLSPVVLRVQQFIGDGALQLIGQPQRMSQELEAGIVAVRTEVARVGRLLAQQLDFEYPVSVEDVVLRSWQLYRAQQ